MNDRAPATLLTDPVAATVPTTAQLTAAVEALTPTMLQALSDLVAAPSPSGAEQPAVAVMERLLAEIGLPTERIFLDSAAIADSPLFSCPCDPDGGRYNLLARHLPDAPPAGGTPGRSVLFNGHLDVVPTGPDALWQCAPFEPRIADGWLHGRGSGDMKGGIVCALVAYQALLSLGLKPAGTVGFNAVLEEENTGNGTLATVHALKNAMSKAKLADFDVVVIPEPSGETLLSAQVGVSWLFVDLTGRPAHVAYMNTGLNPIEAAHEIMADLKLLQDDWNSPAQRHPAFAEVGQPINFNLGRIDGGEWNSSVPCTCTMSLRLGYYPDQSPDEVVALVSERIRAKARALDPALGVAISTRGHRSPGCVYDLDTPAMVALADAHQAVHGTPPARVASTATNDGRHFRLLTDIPVTNYGPLAKHIHGLDEGVEIASLQRVAVTLARFMADWCGVQRA